MMPLADLPGLDLAIGPSQRGFTVADQVDRLVSASEADPDMGFMARLLALCCLPRSNPGNRHQYKRVNGPFRLYMQAGPETKLPFGTNPRLILAWVCSEAVRTGSRDIVSRSVPGDQAVAFILGAASHDEADQLLRHIPLWPGLNWEVTPLQSFEGRAAMESAVVILRENRLARYI